MDLKEVQLVGPAWTDVLDPGPKPYLVQNLDDGRFHVLYWRAWFNGPPRPGTWVSSAWYDEPDPTRKTPFSKKAGAGGSIRVWELPNILYAPSIKYTDTPRYKEQSRGLQHHSRRS